MRSEHGTRYVQEPHIKILNWNKDAISRLLEKKIEMLDDEFFYTNNSRKNLTAWLGRDTISNTARVIQEPIEQYILRHTRLLPRDIIITGNRLSSIIQRVKRFQPNTPLDEVIRQGIAEISKFFGDEQLSICGNQIISDLMPKDAGRRRYADVYTADKEYIRGMTTKLKKLIADIGKDRFSNHDLEKSEKLKVELFGETSDPFSVLWQNGLLGYTEKRKKNERAIFFSEERMDEFHLPEGKIEYVFHSCLIDSVGIKSIGKPVIPF